MAHRSALKRLIRDLKELSREPLEGASLAPAGENLFELHGNIVIPEGPYEGLLVHFILRMKDTFPASSPSGCVAPGFPFSDKHHEHLHGGAMCNDMLSDYESFFKAIDGGERKVASGWSSGVTLSSLLIVLKHFLADIDLPKKPSKKNVDKVFEAVKKYRCPGCPHTSLVPCPELPPAPQKKGGKGEEEEGKEEEISEEEQMERVKKALEERARSLLICSASKENYVDGSQGGGDFMLGYPVSMTYDSRKRMWTTLIPELMSYEHYVLQIMEKGVDKLDNFQKVSMRTPGGHLYTNWLPIYIDEAHFSKNRQCVENTVSVLSNGIEGTVHNEFKPWMVLRVLPCLMNKMVVAMMDGNLHESENAIYAYCHYMGLFKRFLDDGAGKKLRGEMDKRIKRFISDSKWRNKEHVPDLGEMMVCLALSDKYSFYDEGVQRPLMEEAFARKVFWIEKNVKKDEGVEEERSLRREEDRELEKLESMEMERRLRVEAERLSGCFPFRIGGYGAWVNTHEFPSISSSSSSSKHDGDRAPPCLKVKPQVLQSQESGLSVRMSCTHQEKKKGGGGMALFLEVEVEAPQEWGRAWELECDVHFGFRREGGAVEQFCKKKKVYLDCENNFLRTDELYPLALKGGCDASGHLHLVVELTVLQVQSKLTKLALSKPLPRKVDKTAFEIREKRRERRAEANSQPARQELLLKHLQLHFDASDVASKLMVFNLMASTWFTCQGAKERLRDSFGIPPQGVVDGFQQVIKNIKQMKSYPDFLKATTFDKVITNPVELASFIRESEVSALEQGYLHRGTHFPFCWRKGDRGDDRRGGRRGEEKR